MTQTSYAQARDASRLYALAAYGAERASAEAPELLARLQRDGAAEVALREDPIPVLQRATRTRLLATCAIGAALLFVQGVVGYVWLSNQAAAQPANEQIQQLTDEIELLRRVVLDEAGTRFINPELKD